MESTENIKRNLLDYWRGAMQGKKFGLSHPIPREENGGIFLAFFITTPDTQTKTTPRPAYYFLADITSGKMRYPFQCKTHDFCNEPYDRKYRTDFPNTVTREVMEKLYGLLDRARQSIIETKDPVHYRPLTDKYMARLKEIIPPDMTVFYEAMYRLPEASAPIEEPVLPEEILQKTEEIPPAPVPKPAPVPVQEPVSKDPIYTIKDVDWQPDVNLSSLPEEDYQKLLKVAEAITFLTCDTEGQIRYAYPLFCFDKDRRTTDEIWTELIKRIDRNLNKQGHFRLKPKRSIYTKCPNAKEGCLFTYCPYIAASYVKYLQETDPKRLEAEREQYRKGKEEQDRKKALQVSPESVTPEPKADIPAKDVRKDVRGTREPVRSDPTPVKEAVSKPAPGKTEAVETALVKFMDKNSFAFRCLTRPDVTCVYGTIVTWCDDIRKEPAVAAVQKALQNKGFTEFRVIKDTDDFKILPKTAYYIVVTGERKDLSVFRHFEGTSAVLLAGRKSVLDELIKDPVIGNIYRRCTIRGAQRDYGAIYDRLMGLLPDHLKQSAPPEARQSFITWLSDKSMPDTDPGTAEFLAWQCRMDNRLIFLPKRDMEDKKP